MITSNIHITTEDIRNTRLVRQGHLYWLKIGDLTIFPPFLLTNEIERDELRAALGQIREFADQMFLEWQARQP